MLKMVKYLRALLEVRIVYYMCQFLMEAVFMEKMKRQ